MGLIGPNGACKRFCTPQLAHQAREIPWRARPQRGCHALPVLMVVLSLLLLVIARIAWRWPWPQTA